MSRLQAQRPTPPLHPSPSHHLALKVLDLERTEQFYAQTLGLPILARHADSSGADRSTWLDLGGCILMLERSMTGHQSPPAAHGLPPASATPAASPHEPESPLERFNRDRPGWHLLALRIDAAHRDDWKCHLEHHGFPVVSASPFTLYVLDPEGNRVGLSHYPDPA